MKFGSGQIQPNRIMSIVMQSPGAAWQCILIRRPLGFQVTVRLVNHYDDNILTIDRFYPSIAGFPLDPEGWPLIEKASFRLLHRIDKHGTYISGFIEDNEMESLQWDIRLLDCIPSTDQDSYSAQGRIIFSGQEILFPSTSTRLSVSHDLLFADI